MNLQAVLQLYQRDTRLQSLVKGIQLPHPQYFHLTGLYGSATSFVSVGTWAQSDANHLFILNDKEEAAYFQNDLENLSQALDIFYFPDSFKKTGVFSEFNSSHSMLRTEALMRFSGTQAHKKVLVTYSEALFEKVAGAKAFNANMVQLKVGDVLKVDPLLEKLVQWGFEYTDFVYEPGQYAVRGGILDIYSFGNDKPYRIELFGDDIDSIRLFDAETQLSERKLTQVTLIANMDTHAADHLKSSLLEFLPENTVVWMKDPSYIQEVLHNMEIRLEEWLTTKHTTKVSDEETLALKDSDFVPADILFQQILAHHCIVFGSKALPEDSTHAVQTLAFDTSEQPVFNRQFDLLIKDLAKHSANKYTLFIFAENPRQLERLRSIFEDLKAEFVFYPIATPISNGFIDHAQKMAIYTDHQIFQRYHKYKLKQAYNKNKALTLKTLRELQSGDFVTHIDHGVGMYSGLQKIEVGGKMQEAIRIVYKNNDLLYVNINSLHKISKYTGKEGVEPKVNKLGSDAWDKLKEKAKTQVKDIAKDLIKLYAARKAQQGFAHQPDTYLQTELEASFLYEDTPDQGKAVADVKRDMESPSPMDRLVCGDVGFGKTEVAVRAAFKSIVDGKQAAVLVPTTILAFQHYKTFSDRLKDFPCTVDFLNRFKSAKQKKETLQKLAEGKIDIIIGTHALLGKDVKFKDLGVLVVDEEQKFGVTAKEKLKQWKVNVDTLTLTATPIPRTLQFSLMGARDLSVINTPPPNRQPIETEVHVFDQELIRDAIYYEAERGGQVYFIHNRIQGLREMAGLIQGLCPDLSIGTAHGQLEGHELESVIMDFIDRKYDVLVCTNIVESGVDISNANTIIINNAHHFGLSDLHQLRGRVGRSNKKAFCYLLAPPISTLPADSRKRLQTLEQHSELGSGFQIAMRDLDIRGAGNLLGGEQSGFIAEIGFDMYQKILDEAIRELKHTDFKDLFKDQIEEKKDFVSDCTIDTDLEILIPDSYVESIQERLNLYQELDNIATEEKLKAFEVSLADRFGPVPPPVYDLFTTIRARWCAIKLGFEKMILKDETLRCYFINNPDSPYFESPTFNHILNYVQTRTNNVKLKQAGKNFLLIASHIKNMTALYELIYAMSQR
ncbi:transcription-repair coupling factor [Chitinophaga costaii]|uniref:Transcription-repair-coupling factor n=1 Tax=Chitinophaga costaii TaxID=1335309 RepID=A0A1C4DUQ1_9BACT|nr:transcription-repair coupling factor [Chitinophaga costaii]PUZ27805.1 transcription-repair coupling factor [Chitinophaga costaii]SCC35083.1 transcription-repair coupling factor [Chitinophaga costaii]